MDDRVIAAAMDSFENDDLLHAKELVKGEIVKARNNFIKEKLGLKKDIETSVDDVNISKKDVLKKRILSRNI